MKLIINNVEVSISNKQVSAIHEGLTSGFDFHVKKGEVYQKLLNSTLTVLKASGMKPQVAWDSVVEAIKQTFVDWPETTLASGSKKQVGLQAAMKGDSKNNIAPFQPAFALNNFSSWKSSNWGSISEDWKLLEKEKPEGGKGKGKGKDTPPEAPNSSSVETSPETDNKIREEAEKAIEAASAHFEQKKEDHKSSEPFVFKMENLESMLLGIYGLKTVQTSPDLIACVLTLAEGLGVKLPEVPKARKAA